MPSKIRGGNNDKHMADMHVPRVSSMAKPGGAAFSPTDITGLLTWLAPRSSSNTLSTTGYAGSGTITQSGTTVTGTTTSFLTECVVGDTITATGISGTIVTLTDATHLELSTSATQAVGQAYTITPVAGVSDRITTFADLSGSGNTFTQATASKKAAKLPNQLNGLALAKFHGNQVYTSALNSVSKMSLFFVYTGRTGGNGAFISNTSGTTMLQRQTSNFHDLGVAGWGITDLNASNPNVLTFLYDYDADAYSARIDGVAVGSSATASAFTAGPLAIGARGGALEYLDALVGDVLIYNSILAGTDLTNVETYLKTTLYGF